MNNVIEQGNKKTKSPAESLIDSLTKKMNTHFFHHGRPIVSGFMEVTEFSWEKSFSDGDGMEKEVVVVELTKTGKIKNVYIRQSPY